MILKVRYRQEKNQLEAASGNIEDAEVLKYRPSLRSGTYMEYDTKLK